MAAIFNSYETLATKNLIENMVGRKIEDDYSSRRSDQDRYRGDFGSSTFIESKKLQFKGKTEEKKKEQLADFLNDESDKIDRYNAYAVFYDQDGFLAYKLGFVKDAFVRSISGPVTLKPINGNGISRSFKDFENITALKNWFNKLGICTARQYYLAEVVDKNFNRIGSIDFTEKRIYKTEPKKTPSKYDFVEALYKTVVYSWCPY